MITAFELLSEEQKKVALDLAFPSDSEESTDKASPALLREIFEGCAIKRLSPAEVGKHLKNKTPSEKNSLSIPRVNKLLERAQNQVNFAAELVKNNIEIVPPPVPSTPLEHIYFYAGFGLPLSKKQLSLDINQYLDAAFIQNNPLYEFDRLRERTLYEMVVIEGDVKIKDLDGAWQLLYPNQQAAHTALARAKDRVGEILKSLQPSLSEQRIHGSNVGKTLFEKLSSEAKEILLEKVLFTSENRAGATSGQKRRADLLIAVCVHGEPLDQAVVRLGYLPSHAQGDWADGMRRLSLALKPKDYFPRPTR